MNVILCEIRWADRPNRRTILFWGVVIVIAALFVRLFDVSLTAPDSFDHDLWEATNKKNSSFDVQTYRATDYFSVVPSRPCWRSDCPNPRRNHIVVPQNKAGFDDRLVVISRFANLAGYLCANLYVNPPHLMLHPKHNQGRPVSTDLRWSDFLQFDFGVNQTLLEVPKDFVSAYDFRDSSGRAPDVSITTISYNDTWDTFHALENFTWMQNRRRSQNGNIEESNAYFVWHIQIPIVKMNLFQTEDPIQRHTTTSFPFLWLRPPQNDSSCVYMNPQQLESSKSVSEIANSVFNYSFSHVGVLHLRRGDSNHWCETSVSRIKRFLECSFQNSTSLGNITLLLSTDELDTSYIQEIISLTHENPSLSNVQIRWLDEIIRKRIEMAVEKDQRRKRFQNNYFVYAVSKEVRKRAAFFMEQRRNINCPDCLPIQGLIGQ
jgi:hypothetical protein